MEQREKETGELGGSLRRRGRKNELRRAVDYSHPNG